MSRIIAHRETAIPSICQIRADIPESFEPIFQKMLAKDARRRHRNFQELIGDLRKIQADLPIGSEFAVTESLNQNNKAESPRVFAWTPIALFVLVAALGTYQLWFSDNAKPSGGVLESNRVQASVPTTGPVDLLARVDIERQVQAGSGWELAEGTLYIPESIPSKLHIPVDLPATFHVNISLRRVKEQGPFALGISGPRHKFHLLIDAWRKGGEVRMTALGSTSGRLAEIADNALFLHPQQSVDLVLNVGSDFIALTAGDATVLRWRGDFDDLSLPTGWKVGNEAGVFVGSNDGACFEVTHLELVPGLAEASLPKSAADE